MENNTIYIIQVAFQPFGYPLKPNELIVLYRRINTAFTHNSNYLFIQNNDV